MGSDGVHCTETAFIHLSIASMMGRALALRSAAMRSGVAFSAWRLASSL